jgi:hypothetical protein
LVARSVAELDHQINTNLGSRSNSETPLMAYRVCSQGMLEGEEREVVDVVTKVRDRMVAATETYRANQQRRFDRHRIYILKILKKFGGDTISMDGTFELNQYISSFERFFLEN